MRGWKPWTVQPPAGTPIDWDSPLAQGLEEWITPIAPERYTAFSQVSPPQIVVGSEGVAFGPTFVAVGNEIISNWTNFSWAALAEVPVTFSSYNILLSQWSSPARPYVGTGTSGQYTFGNDLVEVTSTFAAINGAKISMLNSVSTSAGYLYVNGSNILYQTSPAAQSAVTNMCVGANVAYGSVAYGSPYFPWNGKVYLGLYWGRILTPEDAFSWNANPWQIFHKRRRVYSIQSSAGAALAASASDVTTAAGALTTAIQMAASATDATSASGVLSTAIELAAAALDTVAATATLGSLLFADPDYTVVLRSRAFTVRLASRSFTVH